MFHSLSASRGLPVCTPYMKDPGPFMGLPCYGERAAVTLLLGDEFDPYPCGKPVCVLFVLQDLVNNPDQP